MEQTNKPKTNAKDLFLNLGAIVALYTVVISLINLLFSVINSAYPKITDGYSYYGSQSISWPVAILIIFFPIYVLLMWLLEKGYDEEPEKRNVGIRKWLTYITLFLAGVATAGDLVTVIYYFIDGQELTAGFLLKVLTVLVIALGVFYYYISDIREKLNSSSRRIWTIVALVVVLGSIAWGFSVLGSPMTQRLHKYDNAKVMDLQNLTSAIQNYYSTSQKLPENLTDLATLNYGINTTDSQNQKQYEYKKTGNNTYELCAEFNKSSSSTESLTYPRVMGLGYTTWNHPAGRHCFTQTITPDPYGKPVIVR